MQFAHFSAFSTQVDYDENPGIAERKQNSLQRVYYPFEGYRRGTFRKAFFMASSRRLEVRLLRY